MTLPDPILRRGPGGRVRHWWRTVRQGRWERSAPLCARVQWSSPGFLHDDEPDRPVCRGCEEVKNRDA